MRAPTKALFWVVGMLAVSAGGAAPCSLHAQSTAAADALSARIARDGAAAVVVALEGVAPVTGRGASRAAQAAALRRRQDDVLAGLPTGAFRLRRRYAQLAGFAGTVDARGL